MRGQDIEAGSAASRSQVELTGSSMGIELGGARRPKRRIAKIAGILAAAGVIGAIALFGAAKANESWARSNPLGGIARMAAARAFLAQTPTQAEAAIGKALAKARASGGFFARAGQAAAEAALLGMATAGDKWAAQTLCVAPIAYHDANRSVDAAEQSCADLAAKAPAAQEALDKIRSDWGLRMAAFIERLS